MVKSDMHIRRATEGDLDDFQSCARAAYSCYIERMGREPAPMNADFARQIERRCVHVVMCDTKLTGYAVFFAEGDHLHLENVAVLPDQSGKGIGKFLIEYVEDTARKSGLHAIELYTNEAMTENLLMYSRLGYVETERRSEAGFARVFFRKEL